MLEPEVEPEVVVDRELRELGEGEVDESERVRQMDLLQGQSRGHGWESFGLIVPAAYRADIHSYSSHLPHHVYLSYRRSVI